MEMSTSLTRISQEPKPGAASGFHVARKSGVEPRLTCRGSLLRLWVHLGSSGLEGERLCSLVFLQLP